MKGMNFHYITVLGVILLLFYFGVKRGNNTLVFNGFAENKETEIRLEHSVKVKKIYVKSGQKVSKGDLLLEVSRSGLEQTQNEMLSDITSLESEFKIWETALLASIKALKAEKQAKSVEIDNQIAQLQTELDINAALIKDFKSVDPVAIGENVSPIQIRIEGLQQEKYIHSRRINAEIRKLRNQLKAPDNPIRIAIEKLEGQLAYSNEEEKLLNVLSPGDGVIGSVMCKEEESFAAYSDLLTIYEERPTMVKGYVLESLMIHVHEKDSVLVTSSSQSQDQSLGKIIGLGSRIIEIPERLRRNPMIKTYGREVIIQIPSDNTFLQNEKVLMKLNEKENKLQANIFNQLAEVKVNLLKPNIKSK